MARTVPNSGRPTDDRPYPGSGPPDAKPRGRGARQDDPKADSILPGREFGAGGQVDDGPPPKGV